MNEVVTNIPTPQSEPAAGNEPFRRTLTEKVKSFLLGDDIFISYARKDSTGYATALANRLREEKRFICYVDQYGTDVDDELPLRLKRKLWRSTVLVLIGSHTAVKSKPIRDEVELFKKTERAIIPIDVDGAFKDARLLYNLVRGLPLASDPQPHAAPDEKLIEETGEGLRRAAPSDGVIEGVEGRFNGLRRPEPSSGVVARIGATFTYTKRTQWQRRMLVGGFLFILFSLLLTGWSINYAQTSAVAASIARMEADESGRGAAEASKQQRLAETQRQEAEDKRREANELADAAELAAADAAKREELAKQKEAEATANAVRQGKIASSLAEVTQASRLTDARPDEALAHSAKAYRTAPTAEARASLLNNIQHFRNLKYVVRTPIKIMSSMASCLDGRVLAAVGWGDKKGLVFWDLQEKRQLPVRSQPDESWSQIVCQRKGDYCAAHSSGSVVSIFRVVKSGSGLEVVQPDPKVNFSFIEEVYALAGEDSLVVGIHGVKVIGSSLVTGDGKLQVWSLKNPAVAPQEYAVERCELIRHMAASNDGKTVAVVCEYTTTKEMNGKSFKVPAHRVMLWDAAARKAPLHSIELPDQEGYNHDWSMSFSGDNRKLAVGLPRQSVVVINTQNGSLFEKPLDDAGRMVAFSQSDPDEIHRDLLATATSDGQLSVNACFDTYCFKIRGDSYGRGVESLTTVRGADDIVVTGSEDGSLSFWSLHDSSPLSEVYELEGEGVDNSPVYAALNRVGDTLLSLHPEDEKRYEKRYWRMAGKELKPLTPEEAARVNPRDFPPGPMLSPAQSACSQKLLDKYISSDMQEIYTFYAYNAGSPDGKMLAFKLAGEINLYNVAGGRCDFIRTLPHTSLPTSLTFNGGGNLLAVGYYGGEVIIWDVKRLRKQHVIRPSVTASGVTEDAAAKLIALSPDGRFLATSSDKRTMRLWDVAGESLIGQLQTTQQLEDFGELESISFDPLGRKLVTVGKDGVTIWDVSPSSWASRALTTSGGQTP